MSDRRHARLSRGRRLLRETPTEGEKSRGVAWVRAFRRWINPREEPQLTSDVYGVHRVLAVGPNTVAVTYPWRQLRHRSFNFVREANRV